MVICIRAAGTVTAAANIQYVDKTMQAGPMQWRVAYALAIEVPRERHIACRLHSTDLHFMRRRAHCLHRADSTHRAALAPGAKRTPRGVPRVRHRRSRTPGPFCYLRKHCKKKCTMHTKTRVRRLRRARRCPRLENKT